jgi:nucleotide-binding universal stress UspA family protein
MPEQAIAPVVVGVDGSDLAWSALDLAVDEAEARDATLVLVHAGSGEPAQDAPWRRRSTGSTRSIHGWR